MKDRTITQELNISGIRSAMKCLREAQTEVKLTKINGISVFKLTAIIYVLTLVLVSRCACWYSVPEDEIAERQCLLPSQASR